MSYQELSTFFDDFWPISRSITGPRITKSLEFIVKHVLLRIKKIATVTEVFDWIVPPEWKLNSASLYSEPGGNLFSSDDSNLVVLNFSEQFSGSVSYDELEHHLYSKPELPEAILYVTSYYVQRWGLRLSENQKKGLSKEKNPRLEIDTEIFDGFLQKTHLSKK